MAVAVVVASSGAAVVVGGEAAGGVGLDVVDLGVVGGDVAELVEALSIAHFDGATGGAGEDPSADADVLDPVGAVEHDPLDPGVVEPTGNAARRDDGAVGQLAHPPG